MSAPAIDELGGCCGCSKEVSKADLVDKRRELALLAYDVATIHVAVRAEVAQKALTRTLRDKGCGLIIDPLCGGRLGPTCFTWPVDAPGSRPRAVVLGPDPTRVIEGLALEKIAQVVAVGREAADIQDAVDSGDGTVLIVDLDVGDAELRRAIREATHAERPMGVVALAPSPLRPVHLQRALGAGAHACVTAQAFREEGADLLAAAAAHRAFVSDDEIRGMYAGRDDDEGLTATERDSRIRNLVIALIPVSGFLAALFSLLWRRYLGQIGVRPVDLAVDTGSRIADLFFTISVLIGLFGPIAFVPTWATLIQAEVGPGRLRRWVRRTALLRLVLAVATVAVMAALAWFTQLLFALFVGPLVGGLILAKALDLDDDIPAVLRISNVSSGGAVVGAATVGVLFLGGLSYEIAVRGPEFDETGETGWIAPDVLGFNAQPVEVTILDDGSTFELLYLGGNADLYVLVDPCDGDRVDYVSVGSSRLTVIDRVNCDQ